MPARTAGWARATRCDASPLSSGSLDCTLSQRRDPRGAPNVWKGRWSWRVRPWSTRLTGSPATLSGCRRCLFCIVTGAAPIAAMLFNDYGPSTAAAGPRPAPSSIATVAFTVFSVGYIAMARRVTAAGGFYSFVSHGFGQSVGMGMALLIAACYTHLLGRRHRRHGVLREHDDQRLVRRRHPGLGVRVRHARDHDDARVLPHRADGQDPRRLPHHRAHRVARLRLRALFQPARRARASTRCCRGTSSTAKATAPKGVRGRHASGPDYSAPSGHGSASRWRRTTPRSRGIRSGSWVRRPTSR